MVGIVLVSLDLKWGSSGPGMFMPLREWIQAMGYQYESLNIQLFINRMKAIYALIWVLRTSINEQCKFSDYCLLFLKENMFCGHYLNEFFVASVHSQWRIRMDMIRPPFGQGTFQMANGQLMKFSF